MDWVERAAPYFSENEIELISCDNELEIGLCIHLFKFNGLACFRAHHANKYLYKNFVFVER